MDDNIDDLGRKPDGTTLEQPGAPPSPSDTGKSLPDKEDVEPGSDADASDAALGVGGST